MPYIISHHPPVFLFLDSEQVSAIFGYTAKLSNPKVLVLNCCCLPAGIRSIEKLFLCKFWKSQLIEILEGLKEPCVLYKSNL